MLTLNHFGDHCKWLAQIKAHINFPSPASTSRDCPVLFFFRPVTISMEISAWGIENISPVRWDKSLAIQGYTGNRKTLQQYKHSWTCGMPSEVQLLDLTSATLLLQLRITRNTGELLSKITWSTENPAYDSAALIKIHRGLFCCESDVSVGVSFCSCWYST